jgi:hypothetical protein
LEWRPRPTPGCSAIEEEEVEEEEELSKWNRIIFKTLKTSKLVRITLNVMKIKVSFHCSQKSSSFTQSETDTAFSQCRPFIFLWDKLL